MPIIRIILPVALIITSQCNLFGELREQIIQKGKDLYNGAGSCVACHMSDGKGQKGNIPPLAGSDWLKGGSGRSIAISLRGLAGPIKVNGKKYYAAMPPQLLFDDEKLSYILSYVNNAWGNQENIITVEEVAKARKELPLDVFTPQTLLKRFPFEKKYSKKNGTYTPTFDDTLTDISSPVVYRTFMPGASPAAFAVALPGNHYYCWDAGESRLRYVWTKGGFIKSNQAHWSSNGKPVAEFNGTPYYRAQTSLLKDETFDALSKTNKEKPFYDTSQADDFPFKINGVNGKPRFLGYSLVNGYPKFRYKHGKHVITEFIQMNHEKTGICRTFTISPPEQTVLKLTSSSLSHLRSDQGKIQKNGTLSLTSEESAEFSVYITPTQEAN